MKLPTSTRISLIQLSYFGVLLIIVAKLFFIQVIKNKEYLAKASDQHWISSTLSARRGEILTADGYSLATSRVTYLLYAEPRGILKKEEYAEALSPLLLPDEFLDRDSELKTIKKDLLDKLNRDVYWVVLGRGLTEEKKGKIKELNLRGIGFEEIPVRFYPEGSLASQVLGFVAGSEKGEDQGYFGIEGYYNGDLKGKPGRVYEERSASGEAILLGGYRKIPPSDGRDIYLTIDREIQFVVEQKLKEGVEKYGAESGTVVIMDPDTGDIRAMANYPTFPPGLSENAPKESTESLKFEQKNLAITDSYEPGSIIKPLTVSAALDLGLVDPSSTFNDDGPKVYSGHLVDNWNGKHLGIQTVTELLEKSNNIGAAWVGTKVGRENLHSYFKKFGLGEATGITLEGENPGILRDSKEWREIDVATASFGQGITASVIQVAQAFSVFNNGGVLIAPRIVLEIRDEDRVIEIPVRAKRAVLSKATVEKMEKMLIASVDSGESKYFNAKEYIIAGKTGTAQIPVDGKYDPNKTNATFVGFLPTAPSGKKMVMVVKISKPESSIYASETAVPLWMDILREVAMILRLPPDRPK